MSNKKIQDLPLKSPLDAMKIPTGGFGDYAVTLKTIVDHFIEKHNLVQEDQIIELEERVKLELENNNKVYNVYNKDEVYTKDETLTLEREDKYVVTESGRTQRDKNKENPSLFDFKAKGDGVTNDTRAFIDLEKDYQNQTIDLFGKTYYVTSDFKKNKYVNGFFKVASARNMLTKGEIKTANIKYKSNIGNGVLFGEVNAEINTSTGSGSTIVQGFDYHQKTGFYYATRRDSGENENEKMVLVRYPSDISKAVDPILTSSPTNIIGHQSLSHSLDGNKTIFWTIGGSDIYETKARYVVSFEVDSLLNPINVKKFKVWGDEFQPISARCMCITPDYSKLITVNRLISDGSTHCRIFNVADLVDPNIDYSSAYINSFVIARSADRSLQDCYSDGAYIYFLHGASLEAGYDTSTIEIVDMSGVRVAWDEKCTIGRDTAYAMTHKYYEPEALFQQPDGKLGMLVAIGKNAGAGTPTPHRNVIFTCEYSQDINTHITPNWFTRYTSPSATNTGFNLTTDSKIDVRYRLENSLRSGMLQVSANGNIGIYDITNDKWIFYSSVSGLYAFVNATLEVTGDIYSATDNTNKIGASNRYFKEAYVKKNIYSATVFDSAGIGSPEGVVVAGIGSTYRRTDGGTGSTFYVKESGTGNTGWVAK